MPARYLGMTKLRALERKTAGDDSQIILFQDVHDGSWFVGRAGDPTLDPVPLGAFASAMAARRWADDHFRGGTWRPARH